MSIRNPRSVAIGVAVLTTLALSGAVATATTGATTGVQASSPRDDARAVRPGMDKTTVLVQLSSRPVVAVVSPDSADRRNSLTSAAARQQRDAIAAERADFRAWLRINAPKARVIGSHDLAVNAVRVKLHGESARTIGQAPQAVGVEFERLYQPLGDQDPDLALIDAPEGWTAVPGGDADAGALSDGTRIKVGVIDTGIDIAHPCFSDTGFPKTPQLGDQRFTNNKVIVARVFSNKTQSQGYTAEAINDHGTHVAGTVACNLHTDAAVDEADIPYDPSGVAPAAQLGNYNVFPGEVGNARSEDILNALEAAYADGMDVVNMSLGGSASGSQDLLTQAVDNLDRGGMVSAISAGNEGPGPYTVGSPGSAERALTSGASTVGHFVGAPVTVGTQSYGAASGDFATVATALTAPLEVVVGSVNGLSDACAPISGVSGEIALVSRGTCAFTVKVRNAQAAGAVAVLVQNNVAGDPTAMGSDGTPDQPTIPAYMVSLNDGRALQADDGEGTTLSPDQRYFDTVNDDIMAGFSSQGPTDVSLRIKPDVVAPGVNVLSSIPLSYCGEAAETCWAFFQGTSMSSPHTAGAAAVVIDAFITRGFVDYTAEDVRSAIVNTAEQGGLTSYVDGRTVVKDVNIVGAGQLDLDSAVAAQVAVGPVSTSFGSVPSGAGRRLVTTVRLSSLTEASLDVQLSVEDPADAADFGVTTTTATVPADGATVVRVSVAVPKGAAPGDYQADLNVSAGAVELAHSPLYVRVN